MALIDTPAEVKALFPNAISNLTKMTSLPVFTTAEYEYLVPVTGLAFYEDIIAKKAANTLTVSEKFALQLMQLVSVGHTLAGSMVLGHVTVTDTGAKKFTPADTVPVAKWEFDKAELSFSNAAWRALEGLIDWLYVELPALWVSSDAYKQISGLLIKSGKEFDGLYRLKNRQVTFFYIRGRIQDAQELYLLNTLGASMMEYLTGDVSKELSVFAGHVKKALAFFTIAECCKHETVQFDMDGFSVLSTKDITSGRVRSGDDANIELKRRSALTTGNIYLNKATAGFAFLYDSTEASAEFRELYSSTPMYGKHISEPHTTGNERRRIFRFR